METAARGRPSTASPANGSRTLTITNDPTREEGEDDQDNNTEGVQPVGTLKLRGGPKKKRAQRVAWNDDVVDNEFFGKKKSKICCIYHKPRKFDESSSEESSDSEHEGHAHGHAGRNHQPHAGPSQQARSEIAHELEHCEDSEPNTYERQPRKSGKRKAT
ncbi:hypothetical protein M413DRAFT_73108 [Hebeloma cylindrosporum]|uniref:Type 1 phosphatases regulator n=1 Tax=Hebeloma cylindrosporum TaxID=76867 RepID=A0A0C3C975_HEBCY|nr:hypothetical protein M413DRAFT_73108 [Hebeloma cylindrosporum h7]